MAIEYFMNIVSYVDCTQMSRNNNNNCGIATDASYPSMESMYSLSQVSANALSVSDWPTSLLQNSVFLNDKITLQKCVNQSKV